ncbi:MAG: type II secretion system protein GspC [Labilithrix sp.]
MAAVIGSDLKPFFWVIPSGMIAVAAFCNATAVSELVGTSLTVSAAELARPPTVMQRPSTTPPPREKRAAVIVHRNVFDHVTGPLDVAPSSSQDDAEPAAVPAVDDPWSVPACDGLRVRVVVASDDEEWSFASIAGPDGKFHLVRRGAELAGKSVFFIGWDRVWMTSAGVVCQASLFAPRMAAPVVPPPPPPPSAAPRRGAPALSGDLRSGIQAISPSEFNIDRGVVDKILENQAELMRQARIVPVKENGRVVGVRLNGVKPDALLGVLGMQNGDVLKTINGFDMASPEKALEAYARLRTADKLTIRLTRGTKELNIDYNIK